MGQAAPHNIMPDAGICGWVGPGQGWRLSSANEHLLQIPPPPPKLPSSSSPPLLPHPHLPSPLPPPSSPPSPHLRLCKTSLPQRLITRPILQQKHVPLLQVPALTPQLTRRPSHSVSSLSAYCRRNTSLSCRFHHRQNTPPSPHLSLLSPSTCLPPPPFPPCPPHLCFPRPP